MENVPGYCSMCNTDLHPEIDVIVIIIVVVAGFLLLLMMRCDVMGWHNKCKEYIAGFWATRTSPFSLPTSSSSASSCLHNLIFTCNVLRTFALRLYFVFNEFSFSHYSIYSHRMRIALMFIDAHILSLDLCLCSFIFMKFQQLTESMTVSFLLLSPMFYWNIFLVYLNETD